MYTSLTSQSIVTVHTCRQVGPRVLGCTGMAYGNDPAAMLPPPAPPTSRSTSSTGVDGGGGRPTTDRLCRRLALVSDVTAGTAVDVCASPVDGPRVVHAFLSAGSVVEVRLLRDALGPLAAGPDASYGRYFMLQYNGDRAAPEARQRGIAMGVSACRASAVCLSTRESLNFAGAVFKSKSNQMWL